MKSAKQSLSFQAAISFKQIILMVPPTICFYQQVCIPPNGCGEDWIRTSVATGYLFFNPSTNGVLPLDDFPRFPRSNLTAVSGLFPINGRFNENIFKSKGKIRFLHPSTIQLLVKGSLRYVCCPDFLPIYSVLLFRHLTLCFKNHRLGPYSASRNHYVSPTMVIFSKNNLSRSIRDSNP